MKMNKNFSIYLDLIRFLAAMVVLLHHFSDILFNSPYRIFNIGHEAVVIFFVLSGYVIAYSVDIKSYSSRAYFVARFSRIYSVAIPAIFLAIIADLIGTSYCRECYQDIYIALDYPVIRFLSSITFTGELWFISILSFSNIPYWSINYEVFFYVFFGVMIYAPKKHKVLLLVLLSLLAGPKILIMLPLWLFGVYLYKHRPQNISTTIAIVMWLLTLIIMYFLIAFDLKNIITKYITGSITNIFPYYAQLNLAGSKYFAFDYLFSLVFGANLIYSLEVCKKVSYDFALTKIGNTIRFLANRTFSIYLFHFPLLGLFNALLPAMDNNLLRWSSILLATLVSIFILSTYTEQKKYIYSNIINSLLCRLKIVNK